MTINPTASAARVLLVQKLVGQHKYDEARTELEPLLSTAEVDRNEIQEALAEIDISKGRYEAAIARQYAEANMPPQFRRAIESESITRGDLAVLMYWKVASVRFASNIAAPPIAIDIGETPGRDEIVRAIALGIYQVDPVTRQVNPYAPVSPLSLARAAARALAVRGASCARTAGSDPESILAACRVSDPLPTGADVPVSGRMASAMLEQVDASSRLLPNDFCSSQSLWMGAFKPLHRAEADLPFGLFEF